MVSTKYEFERQLLIIRQDERRGLSLGNQQHVDDAEQQRSKLSDPPSAD